MIERHASEDRHIIPLRLKRPASQSVSDCSLRCAFLCDVTCIAQRTLCCSSDICFSVAMKVNGCWGQPHVTWGLMRSNVMQVSVREVRLLSQDEGEY